MYSLLFQRVGSLLVGAVVLSTSALAPALRHAHPGGDMPHEHHAGDHEHSHEHGLHSRVPHVHVCWFGMHWVLAVPESPFAGETDVVDWSSWSIDSGPRIEAPVPAALTIAAAATSAPTWLPTASSASGCGEVRETDVLCRPLCDTARHERSGVQLI
jgi:hypothetical protein